MPAVTFILGLISLAERRRVAGIKFLVGLLKNDIDPLVLLSIICSKVPSHSYRYTGSFYAPVNPPSTYIRLIMNL